MRIVAVWRRESDYGRSMEEWIRDFNQRTGREVESMNPDEDVNFCQTYDIVEYPTILALNNAGTPMEMWRGKELPTFDQVNYWAIK